jgi:glycosyltransferase involved in cell wall biosynthesis
MLLSNEFASDPRVEKEALALASAGWDVTVLAWNRSGTLPAVERREGFAIERVGPVAAYGSGLKNLAGFRGFWDAAARRAVQLTPSVVHCHDLDTAPAGLSAVKALAGTRLVVDFHELYRESRMVPRGAVLGGLARAAIDALERRVLARADAVIVSTEAMRDRYVVLGVSPVVIENAPDAQMFTPEVAAELHDGFRVCYAGQKRYTESLIALAEAVQRDPRFHARLAGGGVSAEKIAQVAAGLERVQATGPFTYAEAPALYRGCDAVYAVYDRRVGNIRIALPVKALEGMASGLPVIVNRDTWMGDFVVREGVGIAVGGESVDELAAALAGLADNPEAAREMGLRGRRYVEEKLNWEIVSARFIEVYGKLEK